MGSELIRLDDGILVEIDVPSEEYRQCSGGTAEQVSKSFEQLKSVLTTICKPLRSTWDELNKDLILEKAEVEIGLSFEGEGNLFVTKAKAGANLTIKLILSEPEESDSLSGS